MYIIYRIPRIFNLFSFENKINENQQYPPKSVHWTLDVVPLCQRPHDWPRGLIDKTVLRARYVNCSSFVAFKSLIPTEYLEEVCTMLVQESTHDVPTTADGQGSMREYIPVSARHLPATISS
jgi:hypothetical protein